VPDDMKMAGAEEEVELTVPREGSDSRLVGR
jgi:hypothetical protein